MMHKNMYYSYWRTRIAYSYSYIVKSNDFVCNSDDFNISSSYKIIFGENRFFYTPPRLYNFICINFHVDKFSRIFAQNVNGLKNTICRYSVLKNFDHYLIVFSVLAMALDNPFSIFQESKSTRELQLSYFTNNVLLLTTESQKLW